MFIEYTDECYGCKKLLEHGREACNDCFEKKYALAKIESEHKSENETKI